MKSFRSRVFKTAHKIVRNFNNMSFGEALRTAWHIYRTEKERAKYIIKKDVSLARIEQIARNINAFNTLYDYIDGYNNKWQFWSDLRTKLEKILETLTDNAKEQVRVLCEPQQAEYFGLY